MNWPDENDFIPKVAISLRVPRCTLYDPDDVGSGPRPPISSPVEISSKSLGIALIYSFFLRYINIITFLLGGTVSNTLPSYIAVLYTVCTPTEPLAAS